MGRILNGSVARSCEGWGSKITNMLLSFHPRLDLAVYTINTVLETVKACQECFILTLTDSD